MLGGRLAGGDQAIDLRGDEGFLDVQVAHSPPEFDAYSLIGRSVS